MQFSNSSCASHLHPQTNLFKSSELAQSVKKRHAKKLNKQTLGIPIQICANSYLLSCACRTALRAPLDLRLARLDMEPSRTPDWSRVSQELWLSFFQSLSPSELSSNGKCHKKNRKKKTQDSVIRANWNDNMNDGLVLLFFKSLN